MTPFTSIATAVLRAGSIPGLVQKLVIETDLTRKEHLVPNTALNFSLSATAPVWTTVENTTSGTVTLTANVNAQDGTPILWQTTRGQLTQQSSVVSGGQAQATVLITGWESTYGLGVFTAAVGNSIAKASVPMVTSGPNPPPASEPGAESAVQAITGLVDTMVPSNGAFTPAEEEEVHRSFQAKLADGRSTGFVSGILELFPLEGGGGLQNQAAHANWRLRLAEFFDGQTAAIRQAAEEADKVHITDAEGVQLTADLNNGTIVRNNGNGLLLETDFGTEVMRAIRETGGDAGWVMKLEKTLGYARSLNGLVTRSKQDFEAFISSYGSSTMMPECKDLVNKLGMSAFSNSHFKDAVEYFTPEGTTRLLKSLNQFTQTAQANQTVFAGLVFEDIGTNLLRPKLNAWADTPGNGFPQGDARRAVANVGFYFQLFTTAGTLTAMAGDANNDSVKFVKRVGGRLLGVAISAALGSEQAKAEVLKMAPITAEIMLGLDLLEQWKQGDYFEAGRTEFNFDLQVVGDVTIAIPLAKGAAAALRVGGLVSRKVVAQGLRRAGQASAGRVFERPLPPPLPVAGHTLPPPLPGSLVLPKKCKMPAPVNLNRHAGVTYLRHIKGLWGETKFAHYLHYMTDEIVIRWGDGVGTHGADIITVNSKTGRVTLWDTKWRTNPTMIGPSKTFSESGRLSKALDQAERALDTADYIPSELRQKALDSITYETYNAHTPGMGAARSSGVQFGPPPP
jgi:hypothetical protein